MITATEFKKHINKSLSSDMRNVGFKGSGFKFVKDSKDFVFAFGLQASRFGANCCAEFGIQPKEIEYVGDYKLELSKLDYSQCELRKRICRQDGLDLWWKYSENKEDNILTAKIIFNLFSAQALPIFKAFEDNPKILDTIKVSDLENCFVKVAKRLHGISPLFGNIRFAWALMKVYEKKDPHKAKQFAEYGLSKLDPTSLFFGKKDFEKLVFKNGA